MYPKTMFKEYENGVKVESARNAEHEKEMIGEGFKENIREEGLPKPKQKRKKKLVQKSGEEPKE